MQCYTQCMNRRDPVCKFSVILGESQGTRRAGLP